MRYLLHHLSALAARRAMNIREEAQLWDILSRDLKRAAQEQEELKAVPKPARPKVEPPAETSVLEDRLYVRVKEAQKIMGLGRSSLYKEIAEGRLPIRKAGRKTMIAMSDIHAWFAALPPR
jgi:excisionase family DNA binding protein